MALLEAVPNVSVGRDLPMVDRLAAAVRGAIRDGAGRDGSRALLADVHRDADHDRSVFTLVGWGDALRDGLLALADGAIAGLDVHAGHGVHPRVGVLDVLPVVPLAGLVPPGAGGGEVHGGSAAHAHELLRELADDLGTRLGVPVVRYGLDRTGAGFPDADHAGAVRRGGPATVLERVSAGELELLAGPAELHPTAGVTVAGVRDVLVAFNVELDVDDLELARDIAARIRATAAGAAALPGVRALGLRLATHGRVQVSTNVERHRECGPARVLETVARLAAERGATVRSAELVGLAPASALAALRYACANVGAPLAAGAEPSLDAAIEVVLAGA